MHFKDLCCAVGITVHIMRVISLPVVGNLGLSSLHLLLAFRLRELTSEPGPNGLVFRGRANRGEHGSIFTRSPEDIVPVEECKRALRTASILDEALYRRCAGEGEGEGEGEDERGGDGYTEESDDNDIGGNDDDGGDIDNAQIASNSPRQDCILTQMGLFPMPNFGLCESLPDTPPTPSPAPPITPVPAPAPDPGLAPPPARKPVPVDAGGPARAIPKRVVEDRILQGV